MGHVTFTAPILDAFYLCTKFDDFSLNRSPDIIGAQTFKVGTVILTTPL